MTLPQKTFQSQCHVLLILLLLSLILMVNFYIYPATQFWWTVSPLPENEVTKQCPDEWPDLELLVPTAASVGGERELNRTLLLSLGLFWPKRHLRLALITDEETPGVDDFCERIQNSTKTLLRVTPRCVKSGRIFEKHGWQKSQWLKFWADNLTKAEFVGFIDTDALFVTRVALEDIFVGGKPVVTPIYGPPDRFNPGFFRALPGSTFRSTGFKEPFNCMSFFPVIIKRSHFSYFREHIRRIIAPDGIFDDAFINIRNTAHGYTYSEFNIMCAIMWNVFRSDYHWRIHEAKPRWNSSAHGQARSLEESNITSEYLKMSPTLTIHEDHHPRYGGIRQALRIGVCYGMTDAESRPSYCASFGNRTEKANWLEFSFEGFDFSNRSDALAEHRKRLVRNDKCPHAWPTRLLNWLL